MRCISYLTRSVDTYSLKSSSASRVSYRILTWGLGVGGEHGGSRMIVAHVPSLLGRSGGMLPQESFEFRSSQIASDAICDKIVV